MLQPTGFINKDRLTFVFKLQRALYGLKQAPRAWYKELSNFLLNFGFKNTMAYSSFFFIHVVQLVYIFWYMLMTL